MKLKNLAIIICITVLAAGFGLGCGSKQSSFGKEISISTAIKIKDILSNLDKYKNELVRVEGKIIRECPTGCWFDLKDDTAEMRVDLKPSGLAIPQRVGSQAIVEGKVVDQGYIIEIIGEGVRIK